MSVVILEGKVVHYEVLGRGRPIFFLHSWIGSWRYWLPAMQAAANSFRSYALDLWGFGDTTHDHAVYSIDDQVSLVSRFKLALGVGKVALVGHGLGALAALQLALEIPGSVDRLMLVDAPVSPALLAERLRSPGSFTELVDWLTGKEDFFEPARTDALKADPLAISSSLEGLHRLDIMNFMDSSLIPCLMIYGQDDPAVQPMDDERVASGSPLIHQLILEGSGHFPMLDGPARFNRLMLDFLALDSGDSPRELMLKDEWKRRVR